MDQPVYVFRVVGWYFYFHFNRAFYKQTVETQRFAASDLGLHCVPMSHKKDARVKKTKKRFRGTYIVTLKQRRNNVNATL